MNRNRTIKIIIFCHFFIILLMSMLLNFYILPVVGTNSETFVYAILSILFSFGGITYIGMTSELTPIEDIS